MLTFTHHVDKNYETALRQLSAKLHHMGEQVSRVMDLAEKAIREGGNHTDAAKQIDYDINKTQLEIEEKVAMILSRHTPVMDEMRFILLSIKMGLALERMGDMAKNVVKRIKKMGHAPHAELGDLYLKMIGLTREILKGSLHQISHFKPEEAVAIRKLDADVDQAYRDAIYEAQQAFARKKEKVEDFSHALFLSKNLERMADHATSLVKYLYYVNTREKLPEVA